MAKASPTQAWLCIEDFLILTSFTSPYSQRDMCQATKLKYVPWFNFFRLSEMSKSKKKLISSEFLNKTLHAYFKEEGIEHQTSTPRTPEQNGVVERRNRTLVEAARTMLSASKLPLSFWAEAVATACYTQNRSIIIRTHEKWHITFINDRTSSIKHLHILVHFEGITFLTTREHILIVSPFKSKFENQRNDVLITNTSDLRTKRQEMSVENVSSGLVPQGQKASDYDNSDPVPPRQNVVPTAEKKRN
ncbi:retrovirus-related pol polyprotein from transposon TNT 1-94 [Tanacetum coccineum]